MAVGRADFRRRNSEKSFEKDLACVGQLVGETESACVAAAAALGLALFRQRCGERLHARDTVRRFEETQDEGWRLGGASEIRHVGTGFDVA